MPRLIVRQSARDDVDAITFHIMQDNPDAALRFFDAGGKKGTRCRIRHVTGSIKSSTLLTICSTNSFGTRLMNVADRSR